MSQGDILIEVDSPEEIDLTVEDPPDIDISVVPSPDIVLVTAANVGPQGPQGAPGVGVLPSDIVVPTGFLIRNRLLVTDTQPVLRLMERGKLEWGPGGSTPPDTQLERTGPGVLYSNAHINFSSGSIGGEFYDASGKWFISGEGAHEWGPGDWSRDTNLYRQSANLLRTDDSLSIGGELGIYGNVVLHNSFLYSGEFPLGWAFAISRSAGDADNRFTLSNDGHMYWGGGVTGPDCSLYRWGAGYLKTDESFTVHKSLYVDAAGVGYPLYFGASADTSLTRIGVGQLQVNGAFTANAQLSSNQSQPGASAIYASQLASDGYIIAARKAADSQWRMLITADGKLMWGPGGTTLGIDTTLYRNGAGALYTDGSLAAANYLVANANVANQIALAADGRLYFGIANDTNLFRGGANALHTDDNFVIGMSCYVGTGLVVDNNNTGQKLYFGPALDTNLYRAGANALKTDDSFYVAGQAIINHGLSEQIALASDGKIILGSALDTNLYRSAADTLKTDDSLEIAGTLTVGGVPITGGAAALTPATTLPGSPTNKQQAILTDSLTAPTWQWLCQYDSTISDTYKWRVIGPLPIGANGKTNVATSGYTTACSLAAPRSGIYFVVGDIFAGNGAADPLPRVRVNGTVVEDNGMAGAQYSRSKAVHYKAIATLAATQTVDVQSQANGSDGTWAQGSVSLIPVRII